MNEVRLTKKVDTRSATFFWRLRRKKPTTRKDKCKNQTKAPPLLEGSALNKPFIFNQAKSSGVQVFFQLIGVLVNPLKIMF